MPIYDKGKLLGPEFVVCPGGPAPHGPNFILCYAISIRMRPYWKAGHLAGTQTPARAVRLFHMILSIHN
jgi:hypothetical protein